MDLLRDPRRLLACLTLAAATAFGGAVWPAAAVAQDDWSVEGGAERRQEIVSRYKKLLEKNPSEGLIFKKLVEYVGRGKGLDHLVAEYEKKVESKPDNLAYQLILGHLLKVKNDYEAALAHYDRAVELAPKDPVAWMSRGSARLQLEKHAEAAADFERALELEDNRDKKQEILRQLADIAFGERDWEAAEKYYDQLIALDPRNEYLRLEYAQVLVKYKRFDKAVEQYEELVKLAGRDVKARATTLRDLGDVYERMGKTEAAVETYQDAARLVRDGHWLATELRQRIIDVYRNDDRLGELVAQFEKEWRSPNYEESMTLAKLYDELGQEDKALEYYRRASRKSRREVEPRQKIIQILERRGKDAEVVDAYQQLIRMAPDRHRFQFDLVRIHFRMGDRKKAERLLERIGRRFSRDPGVYLMLADTYMRYDMRDKAQNAYERLVRLDPNNEGYILSLGEFYYRAGNLDEALETWRRVLDTRLPKAEAHALLGQTLAEHGLIDKGLGQYEKAVEIAPDDLRIRRGLAVTYVRARRWEEAIDAWRHIMAQTEETEQKAEARGRIIAIYKQQNRLDQKMREFEQAFAAEPPDREAGLFLAEAYLKQNDYEQAEAVFQKLVGLDGAEDEGDLEALHALERIYQQTGQRKKAIVVLEKLAKLRPRLAREYYHRIAELSLELYEDDKAVRYARRAVEQNPNDATAHARLADVYRQMDRLEAAAREYQVAIDLDPRAFDHYFRLADLLIELGRFDEAEKLYRTVVKKGEDESLILKAGRKAMTMAKADGRMAEIEDEFSPLMYKMPPKPVYRKLLLELYDQMVTPMVARLRYGLDDQADKLDQELAQLGQRALPALTDALQSGDIAQRALAIRLLGDLRQPGAALSLARVASDPQDSLRTLAAIAVARIGEPRAAGPLVRALDHDDPAIRETATWALGFVGGEEATDALTKVLRDGQSWEQQALAAVSLGRIGGQQAVGALVDAFSRVRLSAFGDDVAVAAVWALGRTGSDRAVAHLVDALHHGSAEVRGAAAWSLARTGSDEAFAALLEAYWSGNPDLREAAARGLVQLAARAASGQDAQPSHHAEVTEDLEFVSDRVHEVRTAALVADLGRRTRAVRLVGESPVMADHLGSLERVLASRLEAGDPRVVRRVLVDLRRSFDGSLLGLLGAVGPDDRQRLQRVVAGNVEALRRLAASGDPGVRAPAIALLGTIGDRQDLAQLLEWARSERRDVRIAALLALGEFAGQPGAAEVATEALADQSFAVRQAAASVLGELDAGAAALFEALDDPYTSVAAAAARSLAASGDKAELDRLASRLDALALPVQQAALEAMASRDDTVAQPILERFRDHRDARLRQAATPR